MLFQVQAQAIMQSTSAWYLFWKSFILKSTKPSLSWHKQVISWSRQGTLQKYVGVARGDLLVKKSNKIGLQPWIRSQLHKILVKKTKPKQNKTKKKSESMKVRNRDPEQCSMFRYVDVLFCPPQGYKIRRSLNSFREDFSGFNIAYSIILKTKKIKLRKVI